jgi:hypothetical protein
MIKQKESFSDAILEEPNRFLKYAFKINPHIKDFGDFQSAFRDAFNTPLGRNSKMDEQDIINLFETSECKRMIKQNVSDKEYERLYGDGVIVQRQMIPETKKVRTISSKKITYQIKGKTIIRGSPKKYSNAEIKFIQVRKYKKVSRKQIIKEYLEHFINDPRTESSLSSKIYRTKK